MSDIILEALRELKEDFEDEYDKSEQNEEWQNYLEPFILKLSSDKKVAILDADKYCQHEAEYSSFVPEYCLGKDSDESWNEYYARNPQLLHKPEKIYVKYDEDYWDECGISGVYLDNGEYWLLWPNTGEFIDWGNYNNDLNIWEWKVSSENQIIEFLSKPIEQMISTAYSQRKMDSYDKNNKNDYILEPPEGSSWNKA